MTSRASGYGNGRLQALRDGMAELLETPGLLSNVGRTLCEEAIRKAGGKEATISFCGHFNSGKSTTLNAILGRRIFPMGPFPETGVIAEVRRNGVDSARLIVPGESPQEIECSEEGLRAAGSLLDQHAGRVARGNRSQIEVGLAYSPIPPGCVWMDVPGIADMSEMEEVAVHAIENSDIVTWVLNGRQSLSDSERVHIIARVKKCGPHSLRLVLNIFVAEDELDEWHEKKDRLLRGTEMRLREIFSGELPRITAASSLQVLHGNEGFGADDLREMLQDIRGGDHVDVTSSRAHRLEAALAVVGEEVSAQFASSSISRKLHNEASRKCGRDGDSAWDRFVSEAERCCVSASEMVSSGLLDAASHLSMSITAASLRVDNSYEVALGKSFRSVCEGARLRLRYDLESAARAHAPNLTADFAFIVEDCFPTPHPEVTAVVIAPQAARTKSMLIGAAFGLPFGPLGIAIGGAVGRAIGDDGKATASRASMEGTRANILAAARKCSETAARRCCDVARRCGDLRPLAVAEPFPFEKGYERLREAIELLSRLDLPTSSALKESLERDADL